MENGWRRRLWKGEGGINFTLIVTRTKSIPAREAEATTIIQPDHWTLSLRYPDQTEATRYLQLRCTCILHFVIARIDLALEQSIDGNISYYIYTLF